MSKDKRPNPFCKAQVVCKETPKDRYHCETRLVEGYNCTCPYNKSDIKAADYYGDGKLSIIIQKNPKPGADGVCQNFEILPDVKKDLIAKVVKELKKS